MGDYHSIISIKNGIRSTANFLSKIASLMLFLMMILGAFDVIGRYIFNKPITGAGEMSQLLMGGMVFLGWAHTQKEMSHVTVDIFFLLYPPRVKNILSFIAKLAILILFAVIVWKSASLALTDWQEGKLMNIIQIPIAPFKALIPVGALFLCLECIIQLVDLAPAAFLGEDR